jgi:hypothetical protein
MIEAARSLSFVFTLIPLIPGCNRVRLRLRAVSYRTCPSSRPEELASIDNFRRRIRLQWEQVTIAMTFSPLLSFFSGEAMDDVFADLIPLAAKGRRRCVKLGEI